MMDDFKRPSHPDFMSATELKQIEWSGIRMNSVTQNTEIWIRGRVEREITPLMLMCDSQAITKAFDEIFKMHEGQVKEKKVIANQ